MHGLSLATVLTRLLLFYVNAGGLRGRSNVGLKWIELALRNIVGELCRDREGLLFEL